MKIPDVSHRRLILGGVKSGKSRYAEQMATSYAQSGRIDITFIATALAGDDEIQARIERHKADRDKNWQLVEEPLILAETIRSIDQQSRLAGQRQCIVVDCLTMWITNLLMQYDESDMRREVDNFRQVVEDCQSPLIMVSNETNLGITPIDELSRRFCDETGLLHQALGQTCDHVVLMVAGIAMQVKGMSQSER